MLIPLGLLPGFIWLVFYLNEDLHPEPKGLIALTFFFGIISAFAALYGERILNAYMNPKILTLIAPLSIFQLFYLVGLAAIEETVKFLAAYMSVHKNREFNEPVDAMIYTTVAALGFATIENLGALNNSSGGTAMLSGILTTTSIRFVGATLLHSLTSGFVGYYWALGIREFGIKKYLFAGLALATILHTIFNYLIINFGNLIYIVVFLIIIGFFVLNDFEKLKKRAI
ncbi:MAG: PrsW family intramembrane metalloprotease [Candidatus Liptonbacteria bacterium]|nr:PrsW family intramembrane metalloprotease [Candidatus Liptonbacteria bacterium]